MHEKKAIGAFQSLQLWNVPSFVALFFTCDLRVVRDIKNIAG